MTGDTGISDEREQGEITGPVNALAIISDELMETIRNAHLAVEDCVDAVSYTHLTLPTTSP